MKNLITVCFLVLAIVGCDGNKEEKVVQDNGPKIQWFQGTMEQALEQAKANDKALFVYWGASWCPPCNLLKTTVFRDAAFVESTKKFISVYLDGDTESAQKWGEKLKASGYPTLMVLNSKGDEVVRLTTTLPAKSIAATMDAAFERLDPVKEVVTKVLAKTGNVEVTPDDWVYLANYAWTQDEIFKSKKDKLSTVLEKIEAKVPASLASEKSRFFLNLIVAKGSEAGKNQKLPKAFRDQATKRLTEILQNAELVKHNMEFLSYYSGEIIKAVYPEANTLRDAVIGSYKSALENARKNLAVGDFDRLASFYPVVELTDLMSNHQTIPDEEKAKLKEEMVNANKLAKDEHSKIFTTNTSTYILYKAGLSELAKQILHDDIKRGVNDYYTMSSLAWIEKESGNNQEAVEWSEKAYKAAKGSATKIQWGARHITYLMELDPKQKDKIISELDSFFTSNLNASDAFLGRNKSSLEKLSQKLKEWKKTEKVGTDLASLKKKFSGQCKQEAEKKTKYYISDCESYFKTLL